MTGASYDIYVTMSREIRVNNRDEGCYRQTMGAYIGFDDRDVLGAEVGTGKLARRCEALLPEGCRL